jgi:hypothetical protein
MLQFIMKIDIHRRNGNEHYIFLLLHLCVYSPSSSVPSRFFDVVLFFVVCRGDEWDDWKTKPTGWRYI